MHILDFKSIWRDYYDSSLGEYNDFLFKFTNRKGDSSLFLFQMAQNNYLLGVYFDFLARLNKKDSSLIDVDDIKSLLPYQFDEELDTDKYYELSAYYLYRPVNESNMGRYKVFRKNCNYFLMNKDGYLCRVKDFLNDNEFVGDSYTNYLFHDIEEQMDSFKKTSERLDSIVNGDEVKDEDYKLMIDNYKRLYIKKRVYEDILPLCMEDDVELGIVSFYFDYLNKVLDGSTDYYGMDFRESKENTALAILRDYYVLSDKLDDQYKLVCGKNKNIKK